MSLISVEDALSRVLANVEKPVGIERIPLADCAGRTLAEDVSALRDQPPFPASAMDGYAVRSADCSAIPAHLRVIGESAAGRRFTGTVSAMEAVRIFTGAPVPEGADAVVLQEDTERSGDQVTVKEAPRSNRHIRVAGLDFRSGDVLLQTGLRLDSRHIALAAAMGHGTLSVHRKPRVAILATGDELVRAGEPVGPDQITASSLPATILMVEKAGAEAIDLGIARDTLESLDERIQFAKDAQADILVTLGGASVGEHDLVQKALSRHGMDLGFWRVALRPGKPLMHGRLGPTLLLGLPGNPVSSLVCAVLFLIPAIRALLGDQRAAEDPAEDAILGADLPANRERQDYLRAALALQDVPLSLAHGTERVMLPVAMPHLLQDSSMLSILERSDALLVRPPHAPAAVAGEPCRIIRLDRFC
ncbi:molybdopterin molybdotransferase MoeA [Microvirga lotononidis]|uniref:Molybdopterin molybdenumtransferase n=1 Tax=Microvirga lotononidis TaxID=864069 RepID=I4Z0F0_9HYPH|nr:gephyrin-like molybdotransferase Glp [Microvirga lotononidis]EIM29692.1 molybdopterin biosynthesis enzyme [Microvirga lotononidis]WQO27006.1 gephyrin-like molybdotransferase Glp [Microvirga lotononidis]